MDGHEHVPARSARHVFVGGEVRLELHGHHEALGLCQVLCPLSSLALELLQRTLTRSLCAFHPGIQLLHLSGQQKHRGYPPQHGDAQQLLLSHKGVVCPAVLLQMGHLCAISKLSRLGNGVGDHLVVRPAPGQIQIDAKALGVRLTSQQAEITRGNKIIPIPVQNVCQINAGTAGHALEPLTQHLILAANQVISQAGDTL